MKTQIIKVKGDWEEVVNDCRATVGKGELGKEPSDKFKTDILIAEHSPIRDISVKWKWVNIKSWIATHWVRHKWECFVQTQRTDRTGVDRDKLPQDSPVTFTGDANAQALIDTMKKRLCFQASAETRAYAEDFKITLRGVEPQISDVLVPACIYRAGCGEMNSCGLYSGFVNWMREEKGMTDREIIDLCIAERYRLYNEFFYDKRKPEEN